jgi:SAM-dependent methyltransferase
MNSRPPYSESEHYLQPYLEAVRQHGAGFKATLWGSPEAQRLRFEVMVAFAGFDDCIVLDVGCGGGDFAAFLHEHHVPFRQFIGIDAMPEVIDQARSLDLPRCVFEVGDVLQQLDALSRWDADFIAMSGTLNTMDDEKARALVKAAFDAAHQGVVFNFLSDRAGPEWIKRDLRPARRFNTADWLHWSLTLSPRVSFTQDYFNGHDATIMIRHE